MNVLAEVLIIAIGTALLAALIVAADVDLAFIQGWQVVRERWVSVARSVDSRPVPAPWEPPEVAPVSFSEPKRTAADEWLAAAAAHRLADYRRTDLTEPEELTATPLRDVLAARRNSRAA